MTSQITKKAYWLAKALCWSAGCSKESPEWTFSAPTMGTTYTIKVVDAPAGVTIHTLQRSIDTVLQRIDRSMSQYRSDSEISRFNAARSTDWFAVDEDLLAVVKIAQRDSSQ
jgi:thiamine biosynthesis lipoprotein